MSTQGGPRGVRRVAVNLLALVLVGASAALVLFAEANYSAAALPFLVPWWAIAPGYLAAVERPLVYEFRNEARGVTLTQIPLGFALVFLDPVSHVLARVGAMSVSAVIHRQRPTKAFFNLSVAAFEVSVATAVLATISQVPTPGLRLWLALAAALIASEVLGLLVVHGLMALVGVRETRQELVASVAGILVQTLILAGVAIVAVAAAWTDPLTTVVIALVSVGLLAAYRSHRRLAAEQQQTAALEQFIKGLGPLDLDGKGNGEVLSNVCDLLHARHLDLAVKAGSGWTHHTVGDDAYRVMPADDELAGTLSYGGGVLESDEQMSTPLLGAHHLVGVLAVRGRRGAASQFTLRDLRLLEKVAAELAQALERGKLQRDLALAATTDPLTRLPNLNEVTTQLDELVRARRAVLVATVAVDSFREVNDTLGHQVGDELLLEVTRRLSLSYPYALIGRIGGGRFAVAMPADLLGGDPAMFGLSIRAQVEGGAQLGPVGTHIKLSVGCVRSPDHGLDAATLIRRAETAMYSARHAHGGPVVWEPAYEVEGQRRLAVVMALREALASGAIGVAFQPKVSSADRTVTGVEALARWTHPALGAISPAEFIPLAEAAGLMGPLTSSVLRQALTACKGWQRRGGRVGVAVNVSAETVLDQSFVTEVAAILTSINISPDLLTLELTEGVVVNDPALATVRMSELRALGVKISVDDFGTGYSSLTYLKGLPVDEVKVDKGFIDGIVNDAGDRAVVRAVVDIAHTLGLRVVAEGIEQEEQHGLLVRLGVDEVQGYLHARPMAALDMAQWLRQREHASRIE
jgi:diguanylate cyclase (GGDEF)-like protein